MDTIEWYESTVGAMSENAVAAKAGINQRTLNRQLKAGRLTPETIAAIAATYDRDVLDALVVAGLITHEHIKQHGVRGALSAATDRQIADEVWRRLNDGQEHGAFDEAPGPHVAPEADAGPGATVHALPSRGGDSGTTVSGPQVIAAMDDYAGEDMVAEMEGHEEQS